MKGLSVVLSALLLYGAEQLAAHLKRSSFAPSRREQPELSVPGRARSISQDPSVVVHT